MKNIEQALRVFCATDEKPKMMNPIDTGDKVIATNGYIMAAVSKEDIENPNYAHKNGMKMIDYSKELGSEKEYSIEDLKKMVAGAKLVAETKLEGDDIECGYCNGKGSISYKGVEYDCPVCDGDGVESNKREILTGRSVISDFEYSSINDINVRIKPISLIVECMELLSLESTLVYQSKSRNDVLECDSITFCFDKPVEILLMKYFI